MIFNLWFWSILYDFSSETQLDNSLEPAPLVWKSSWVDLSGLDARKTHKDLLSLGSVFRVISTSSF